MPEFKYRDTLEGWVEGLFDTLESYFRTLFAFTFHPVTSSLTLAKTSERINEFTSPAAYLLLSYLAMCILIVPVDFSDRMFSVNLARTLDAIGVLDAAKTVKPEALVVKIIPAVLSLFAFVSISRTVLSVAGDDLDPRVLRRDYSYFLGGVFIMIGVTSAGYQFLVRPLAVHSWWLGLLVHALTFLPLFGALTPIMAIPRNGNPSSRRIVLLRMLAVTVPIVIGMGFLRLTSGSFSLMDYLRTRP